MSTTIRIIFVLVFVGSVLLNGCGRDWNDTSTVQITRCPELRMQAAIEPFEASLHAHKIPFRVHERTLTLAELKEYNWAIWDGIQLNLRSTPTNVEKVVLYEFFTVKGRENEMASLLDSGSK